MYLDRTSLAIVTNEAIATCKAYVSHKNSQRWQRIRRQTLKTDGETTPEVRKTPTVLKQYKLIQLKFNTTKKCSITEKNTGFLRKTSTFRSCAQVLRIFFSKINCHRETLPHKFLWLICLPGGKTVYSLLTWRVVDVEVNLSY